MNSLLHHILYWSDPESTITQGRTNERRAVICQQRKNNKTKTKNKNPKWYDTYSNNAK